MNEPTQDLEMLEALTEPGEVRALEPFLERLEQDTDILVFVAHGCPVCPHQVRSVATVALANPRVAVEIVDIAREQELAAHYEVRSVPTTVVDDELIMVGPMPAADLALRLVERQGPEAEKLVFGTLVESGRHAAAAERLADGRATEQFAHLWERSTPESRTGLMAVLDQAVLLNPEGLHALVPHMLAGLDGEGPLTDDEARTADTADLLGRIGHLDARPALDRLTGDADLDVAEAAQDAVAALDT